MAHDARGRARRVLVAREPRRPTVSVGWHLVVRGWTHAAVATDVLPVRIPGQASQPFVHTIADANEGEQPSRVSSKEKLSKQLLPAAPCRRATGVAFVASYLGSLCGLLVIQLKRWALRQTFVARIVGLSAYRPPVLLDSHHTVGGMAADVFSRDGYRSILKVVTSSPHTISLYLLPWDV